MDATLPVVFRVEQVGEFGADVLVIIVPRARPRGALPPLPFDRVADVDPILPRTETGPQSSEQPVPVGQRAVLDQSINRQSDQRRPRRAPLLGQRIQLRRPILTKRDQHPRCHGE